MEDATTMRLKFEPTLTLEAVRKGMADFVKERDWNQVRGRREERSAG